MPKKKKYIGVNIPREWEPYLKEALEQLEIQKELKVNRFRKTYSGLGCWIISRFLSEKTSFHPTAKTLPRFEHFNLNPNGVMVLDRELNRIVQVYFKPDKIFCEHCGTSECSSHIEFALSKPQVQTILEKKGWKYKER